jgi:hypothetical protein
MSGGRPSFLTDRWDPMLMEATTSVNLVMPHGKEPLSFFEKVDFVRASEETVLPVEERSDSIFQIPEPSLADSGMDPIYLSPRDLQDLTLSSPGLLPSPASNKDPEDSPRSPSSCSADPFNYPRSVMEMFQVSLSSVSKMGPLETVDCQQAGGCHFPSRDFASFWDSCRHPISPVLPRPPARCCRPRKTYASPVRSSRRIRGRFAAGTPIRQQQRTLILRPGLAREGKAIGDEVLDVYLDLFADPSGSSILT